MKKILVVTLLALFVVSFADESSSPSGSASSGSASSSGCDLDEFEKATKAFVDYMTNDYAKCVDGVGDDKKKACTCINSFAKEYTKYYNAAVAANCFDEDHKETIEENKKEIEEAAKGIDCKIDWGSAFGATTGIFAAVVSIFLVVNRQF